MFFTSPTYGTVSLDRLKQVIQAFIDTDPHTEYEIIVGSDSQKVAVDTYDFVSALVVHRKAGGGIYFWRRFQVNQKMSLKERIYREATLSLETSEQFVAFFKNNGLSKYAIQIHVDIGRHGKTREMIQEVTAMIRGSGYDIRIKPESYAASKVADKYT